MTPQSSDAATTPKLGWNQRRDQLMGMIKQQEDLILLMIGLGLALGLRLSFRLFETPDYTTYLDPWYTFILQNGRWAALKSRFSDYSPPYLYLLTLATYFEGLLPKIVSIKAIAMIGDFICSFFIYKIVKLRYPQGALPLFALITFLFAPTVVMNSSLWGQIDIAFTTGLVACLYFLLIQNYPQAMLAFGIAYAFKQQAVFLAPLLLSMALKRILPWRLFLLVPIIYLIAIWPSWLVGRPLLELLTIYRDQSYVYSELTKNAATLYQWIPNQYYQNIYPAGMIFAASVAFFVVAFVYKSKVRFTPAFIIQLALTSVLMLPFFLPKMHDRYFFAADVISILYGFYFPQYLLVPVAIEAVSLFSYTPFLFGTTLIPLPLAALIQTAVVSFLFYHLGITLIRETQAAELASSTDPITSLTPSVAEGEASPLATDA